MSKSSSNKTEKSAYSVSINWYPGHMTKTKRQITAQLGLIDAVAEIVDARIPVSSRNPDLSELIAGKPHIILLNKCDMADKNATAEWIEYYRQHGTVAIPVDCKSGRGLSAFKDSVKATLADRLKAYREKGMAGKPLRVMVVGIPNVGKSSFINRIAGNSRAKVENRPGVTRGNQWFSIDRELELLDTPGVLWPKFDDEIVGEHLAFTGAVTDRIIDTELLAMRLIEILAESYPDLLESRYGVTDFSLDAYDMLEVIGAKRGMKMRGGVVDTERAANMLLEEFRSSKLGTITLERVEKNA